jgi:hypothetical protein
MRKANMRLTEFLMAVSIVVYGSSLARAQDVPSDYHKF